MHVHVADTRPLLFGVHLKIPTLLAPWIHYCLHLLMNVLPLRNLHVAHWSSRLYSLTSEDQLIWLAVSSPVKGTQTMVYAAKQSPLLCDPQVPDLHSPVTVGREAERLKKKKKV